MTVRQIRLDHVEANPFQVRLEEDPGHIRRVAESILTAGLLQIPVGRVDPDREGYVQLAFGHTRLAAFRRLAGQAETEGRIDLAAYQDMPVDIRELSDEMLFELAVRENLERKNLSPIEEARAMQTYRDEFAKTSVEIGVLFGLSDSAVRNKLRLLELPASVQNKVQEGAIHEGAARRLLALQHIAPREIDAVAQRIVSEKAETSEAVIEHVADVLRERAFTMGYGSRARANEGEDEDSTKGRVATGLWPLNWKGGVTAPTASAVTKLLDEHDRTVPEEVVSQVMTAAASGTEVAGLLELFGIVEPAALLIRQMVNPPPCSTCDLHQLLDGVHYCDLKPCYDQKRKAWIAAESARLSRKLGIPVYDRATDGQAFIRAATTWKREDGDIYGGRMELEAHWQKLLEAKDQSLRLKGITPAYERHVGTKSYVVELVRVGPAAEKAKAAEKKQRQGTAERFDFEAQQRRWREEDDHRRASQRFLREHAAPAFASIFEALRSPGVLEFLVATFGRHPGGGWKRGLSDKKAARCARLRELLAIDLLDGHLDHEMKSKGPPAVAKQLTGLAKSLGVKLPADWTKRAEALMPPRGAAGVSADTESEESDDD